MSLDTQDNTAVTSLVKRISELEKRGLLSALWLFVLMNIIFRDIHEIVKAEFLADALNGVYNGVEVTEVMFLLGGIMIQIPIAAMLLTWVLPPRETQWANMLLPPAFALTVIGMPGDLDDYFHFGLGLTALAVIVWQAWWWRRASRSATRSTSPS